jgi:hypothetical protein
MRLKANNSKTNRQSSRGASSPDQQQKNMNDEQNGNNSSNGEDDLDRGVESGDDEIDVVGTNLELQNQFSNNNNTNNTNNMIINNLSLPIDSFSRNATSNLNETQSFSQHSAYQMHNFNGADSNSLQLNQEQQKQIETEADKKRAHHNALERKRRDHIKDSFIILRDTIPNVKGEKVSVSI